MKTMLGSETAYTAVLIDDREVKKQLQQGQV